MARTRSIPLDLTCPEPNDESLESIRKADEIIAEGGRRHLKTADELIASLEA
jgi:antitoxin component of RelBE/YafQ-DinJ toxin-antitoxin module